MGKEKEKWKVPFDSETKKEEKHESVINWEMVIFGAVIGYWVKIAVDYFFA